MADPLVVPGAPGVPGAETPGQPAATATACDAYCREHAVCRLLNDQPVHYFDCERFNVTNYGTRQGKCDCSATADLNEALDAAAFARSGRPVAHTEKGERR